MLKVGIIREGKVPPDERVPLTPDQCASINKLYDGKLEIIVQSSGVRKFKDQDYSNKGVKVQDSISECDVLMGVKEVPIEQLIDNKTYFFFSHTIKKQPYNRKLLHAILEKNITLIDYETLTHKSGGRVLGFGRYAGVVGAYNAFLTFGKVNNIFTLKPAHLCEDRAELETELSKVNLPDDYKIVLTGTGRVGNGALEIINKLSIKNVTPGEFLTKEFSEPVYTQLDVSDYNQRNTGEFNLSEFFEDPSNYHSTFAPYSKIADMYIACHYWDNRSPLILPLDVMQSQDFKIKTIADISCDIIEPIASTIKASTIKDPIFGFDPTLNEECDIHKEGAIAVMSVDNLPCELPRDSSRDFGDALINYIIPLLCNEDKDEILSRATITKKGQLMNGYNYLQSYVDGKE